MTEQPRQIYATQQIDKEAMFGHTSAVRTSRFCNTSVLCNKSSQVKIKFHSQEYVKQFGKYDFEIFAKDFNSNGQIDHNLCIFGLDGDSPDPVVSLFPLVVLKHVN